RDAVRGTIYTFVEFDRDDYTLLYVDESTLEFYDDEETMREHFDRIHSYVHLDLTENDLMLGDLFPIASEVRYITTSLDYIKLLRVYHEDVGLFVALDPAEPEHLVAKAIENALA
ncbi:MAG: hypothetical protein ABEI52_12085, partial [Halobacteriaceae archaeon]